jgi:hypothetical protein
MRFTLTQFNTIAEVVYAGVPVAEVKELTNESYRPEGNTALYDAIAKAINTVARKAAASPITPKVQVIIQTDGEENASKEFCRAEIFQLIKSKQREGNWTFVFLGCDIDAYKVGAAIGVAAGNINSYRGDQSRGTIADMGRTTGELRMGRTMQKSDFYKKDDPDDSGKIN